MRDVTPCVGVRIETSAAPNTSPMNAGSHLAWVCGLKHCISCQCWQSRNVTPCVGVRIETLTHQKMKKFSEVTPCVGVRIETYLNGFNSCDPFVTPCVGVRIETGLYERRRLNDRSHPAWVCGLKLRNRFIYRPLVESHPTWVCRLIPPPKVGGGTVLSMHIFR